MIMAKVTHTPNKAIETLADLTPDPRNARKHNPRNVGMLERALNEVGAARSIVIDENGVVLAGNATIEAAGRLGMERVQVVDADGETIVAVRRTGLTQTQKTRLALYDNRTAELADWDAGVIADLMAKERAMLDGLFAPDELAEVAEELEQEQSNTRTYKDISEKLQGYLDSNLGRLTLAYPMPDFTEIIAILAKAQKVFNCDNNSDVALEIFKLWNLSQ